MKPEYEDAQGHKLITWRNVTRESQCALVDALGAQRSVHVYGEFNGGSLQFELANDVRGDSVAEGRAITQPGVSRLDVPSRFVRPVVEGDAKLTISLLVIK